MLKRIPCWLFSLCLIISCPGFSQVDMAAYEGAWTGTFSDPQLFDFTVSLHTDTPASAILIISNEKWTLKQALSVEKGQIAAMLSENLKLEGYFTEDHSFRGFIQSGILQYHVQLPASEENTYTGSWRPLMLDRLENTRFYLSVEDATGENYAAYPFFGDNRFTGTWAGDFQKEADLLTFSDNKTGLQFEGRLLDNTIELSFKLGGQALETMTLSQTDYNWQTGVPGATPFADWTTPSQKNDGWPLLETNTRPLNQVRLQTLADSIRAGALTYPHAILMAQHGKLIFETYHQGYHRDIPHDQRSASKSIASAMIGMAIDRQLIKDEQQLLYNFLPQQLQDTKTGDDRKAAINLHHLLTMSSGIDAVDFGVERRSAASEDQYQSSPDWLKTVLEAPMINEPGRVAYYGSANPYLLGAALKHRVKEPLSLWMDRQLLAKLGISNYIIQNDDTGSPYFGGGMYLTPRDMLKFGQLYLNLGQWNGEQLLSQEWVEKSFRNYLTLDNTLDKNGYGYLWWHKTYRVKDREIKSIEARGSGGQYIMVIPELELVVVMTSGNYRNGRFQQPETILEEYLLPALTSF